MKDFIHTQFFKYGLIVIVTIVGTFIVTKIIRIALNRYFKTSSRTLKVDPTRFNFVKNALSFLIFLFAIGLMFYIIPELRNLGLSVFASAGILAAVVGFASQEAFSNIISGIFIVIFQPFRVTDIVQIGENSGRVENITLRHTVIRNFENKRVIIPNSTINSATIINYNIEDEKICNYIEFDISYDSDIDEAIRIIEEESMKHPNYIDNRTAEDIAADINPVVVRVIGLQDFSVKLRAWVWSEDPGKGFVMRTDLYKSIKQHFDRAGIEIPFPYRTIVFKNDKEK